MCFFSADFERDVDGERTERPVKATREAAETRRQKRGKSSNLGCKNGWPVKRVFFLCFLAYLGDLFAYVAGFRDPAKTEG